MPVQLVKRLSSIVRKKDNTTQYGAIGIDLGPNGLRMVQFRKKAEKLEVHASAHISVATEPGGSPRQLHTLIRQAIKEHGFIGREIVTCLQPQNVKILMLSFMRQANKKDDELIVQRVAERIDGNIEDYVIDFMMVRPEVVDGQERSVLVALAQHDEVVKHLESLRKAGLVVKLLEIEPTAVRRLISVRHKEELDANLMTISMGDSQTYITVLSGRRLIYERDIDFGEQQLIAALCKELEIDEHEARTMLERGNQKHSNHGQIADDSEIGYETPVTTALYSVLKPMFMSLVEDINRALIYAASETRGMPVKHVYLTNRVATWKDIEKFINTLIEVPVSVLKPFDGFENAEVFGADADPRGAVVTGMALHGLTEQG